MIIIRSYLAREAIIVSSSASLSHAEKELLLNADLIRTKNSALENLRLLLISLQDQQTAIITNQNSGHSVFGPPPKISKGENYLGLPYLILDYPRYNNRENIFFIRSMFWWGNFFSSTLHLSGSMKEEFGAEVVARRHELTECYAGINDDPWIHHFESSNYRPLDRLSESELTDLLTCKPHFKLAARWPLTQIDEAERLLLKSWTIFLQTAGLIA